MVRFMTADLLCDKYGVQRAPGRIYSPTSYRWLLVNAPDVEALVRHQHLLSCLESLRTSTTEELTIWFHIIDWYRGKVKFAWWLELIPCFTNYTEKRVSDEWTQTFEAPLPAQAAISTQNIWV